MADRADELELRALAAHYANAVDDGNSEEFAAVFLPDAQLIVQQGDSVMSDRSGHDKLARVPQFTRSRFDRTFHFLGQSLYDIGASDATGVVYCLAHHLNRNEFGGTDHVMHIRYRDNYRRDAAGVWKIARRLVMIEWTETRTANSPPPPPPAK
jgi:hypothetical protein